MTRRERVSHLMALSAKKEKAELARALGAKQAEAAQLQALAGQIRAIIAEKSDQLPATQSVGALSAALWMRSTLAAELDRSETRASQADEGARTLREQVSRIGARERILMERAQTARAEEQRARDDKEDARQADRPRG